MDSLYQLSSVRLFSVFSSQNLRYPIVLSSLITLPSTIVGLLCLLVVQYSYSLGTLLSPEDFH